jgi:hypothetical protein
MPPKGVRAVPPSRREEILTRSFYVGVPLASEEFGVADTTILGWRVRFPEVWARVVEREGPRLERIAVAQAQEALVRIGEVELRNIGRINAELDELSPKDLSDLAAAQQKLATAKGINGTKLLELTGRPTQIIADRSGAEILRQLRSQVPGLVVEGSAVEEPVRQLEPPD